MVPSGNSVNHCAVFARPGMIRCALQCQVQRHLHAQVARRGDEVVEVVDGAQIRVDGVVAALVAADRPRRPHVCRARRSGCCCGPCGAPCRSGGSAAGTPRRIPSRAMRGKRRGGGGEGAVHRVAVGVPATGRAGKHLVPRAEPGQRPVHPDAVLLAAGDQVAQRIVAPGSLRSRGPAPARCGSPDPRACAAPRRRPAAARAVRAARRSRRARTARRRPAGRWTVRSRPDRRPVWRPARGARCESDRPSRRPGRSTTRPVGGELAVENVGLLTHRHRQRQRLDPLLVDLAVALVSPALRGRLHRLDPARLRPPADSRRPR